MAQLHSRALPFLSRQTAACARRLSISPLAALTGGDTRRWALTLKQEFNTCRSLSVESPQWSATLILKCDTLFEYSLLSSMKRRK